MKPRYYVKAWQENDWWLARVVAASDGADPIPLNALTQARTVTKIESMARDLVATILDDDESNFEVELQYVLPDDLSTLLCEAKGARAWLDAAQELWQERSVTAARALTSQGYSLREAATLLELSHQRVDQLVGDPAVRERRNVLALELKSNWHAGGYGRRGSPAPPQDVDLLVVVHNMAEPDEQRTARSDLVYAQLKEYLSKVLSDLATCGPDAGGPQVEQEGKRRPAQPVKE